MGRGVAMSSAVGRLTVHVSCRGRQHELTSKVKARSSNPIQYRHRKSLIKVASFQLFGNIFIG